MNMSESIPQIEEVQVDVVEEAQPLVYSLNDIAAHNTREDIWIAINSKVYDVTKFLDEVMFDYVSIRRK